MTDVDRKRRRLLAARGIPCKPNPARAAARIRDLQAAGWSLTRIQEVTGAQRCSMRNALAGRAITWETERKILALQPSSTPDYQFRADATGAVRRVRALYATGHRLDDIAQRCGLAYTFVSEIANGRKETLTSETVQAVSRVYDELCMRVGPSVYNRSRAARRGWAGPLHWREDTIDDPAGFPDWTGHCGTTSGWALHLAAGEDPCGPCEEARPDFTRRRKVQAIITDCMPALDALAADEWTWERIGRLFQVSDSRLRQLYLEHKTRDEMGVAA